MRSRHKRNENVQEEMREDKQTQAGSVGCTVYTLPEMPQPGTERRVLGANPTRRNAHFPATRLMSPQLSLAPWTLPSHSHSDDYAYDSHNRTSFASASHNFNSSFEPTDG